MFAVMRKDHLMADRESIQFLELYNEHIITRSFTMQRAIQACCNDLHVDMPPNFEFLRRTGDHNNRMRILNEVSVGQGITFYFKNDIRPLSMRNLVYIPVEGVPRFPVVLGRKKGTVLTAEQQRVWDFLQEEIQSHQDW